MTAVPSGGAPEPPAASGLEMPPLAAYIHIPWCVRKCPYCDFNSHAAGASLPEDAYVDALLTDLDADLEQIQSRRLTSIFFGGGTPSLFSASALARILDGMRQRVGFAEDIEITLEANPGTFEQAKFRDYRSLGINRLSIGVQSFQPAKLKALGRIHDGDEAIRAADMARAAGFDNINLDLMHGLPEQSLEDALSDLRIAIAQQPTHVSWYQLTVEPNTEFWNKPPRLPEDETLWDIQEAGQALLAEHGYRQYETSAYAQPGRQARHNLNYWTFGDFLGLGAGAHGKWTAADGEIYRHWKTRLPKDYLDPDKRFRADHKQLAQDELPFEFLMNVLRLTDGMPSLMFTQRTGLSLDRLAAGRRDAEARGLLEPDPQRLVATAKGQLFLNDLLQLFLP
jgi:oxygen-independent coproporphyrinogen-3 oxidase